MITHIVVVISLLIYSYSVSFFIFILLFLLCMANIKPDSKSITVQVFRTTMLPPSFGTIIWLLCVYNSFYYSKVTGSSHFFEKK